MESPKEQITYLGDGVYVTFDGFSFVLHLLIGPDKIVLEPDVLSSLVRFAKGYGWKDER